MGSCVPSPTTPLFGCDIIKKIKIIISVIISFIVICTSCVCVSAETYKVIDLDLTTLQIKYSDSGGVSLTPWKSLTPNVYNSPYGGAFYGARDSGELIDDAMQWNSNWYLSSNISFKKNVKYTISGYFCVPWDKLVTTDDYWNFTRLQISFCDTSRNIIYQNDYENSNKQASWIKRKIPYFGVDFGFYPVHMEFVPHKDFKAHYFSVFIAYGLLVAPNNRGNFGFSDLTLSYSSSSSEDVASSLEGTNSTLGSIDESLNSDAYVKPDDSKLQEENELTAELYDDTAAGRDTTVDIITGITEDDDPGGGSTTNFLDSIIVWVSILGDITGEVPWFNGLLEFSLALGLFAFLLGLISIAIGSTSKKDKNNKNKPPTKKGR